MFTDTNAVSPLQERVLALEEIQNPSGQPKLKNEVGLFFTADLLYWWTSVSGLSYAVETTAGGSRGTIKNPQAKPEIGFKFGIGYLLPHDGWDFYINGTSLHSRAPIHKNSEEGKLLIPTWTLPQTIANPSVDEIHGHWRLHFAFIDFELGRSFLVSKQLKLRPHIGIRYAIIRQKYLIDYVGGTLFPGGKSYISMKNKFMAPGLRTGVDLTWKIKGDWSLYSELALSILYGEHYVHESEEVSFEEEKRFNIWNCFSSEKVITDLSFGLEWEKTICKERYYLNVHLGYEQHYLFAQNQFFHFTSASPLTFASAHDALSLQGITLGSKFAF